jgi:hypothetical protein
MFRGADYWPLLWLVGVIIAAIAAIAFGLGAWIF